MIVNVLLSKWCRVIYNLIFNSIIIRDYQNRKLEIGYVGKWKK